MKGIIIADSHKGSSKIGGNWPKEEILEKRFTPIINEYDPDFIVFLGDTIDIGNDPNRVNFKDGIDTALKFTKWINKLKINSKNIYMLLGNHDLRESLLMIQEMGGPDFIEDKWKKIGDIGLYFHSTRYEDLRKNLKTIDDVEKELLAISVPSDIDACKVKIMLMHENLIGANKKIPKISKEVMLDLSTKFDIILNGHHHFQYKYYDNIWCLGSSLPWRFTENNTNKNIRSNQTDIDEVWESESPILKYGGINSLDDAINRYRQKYGFYLIDTDDIKKRPEHIGVDIGIDIINISLEYDNATADKINDHLTEIYRKLENEKEKTIVRLHLEGTLLDGEKIDLDTIKKNYYYNFYEGANKNVIDTKRLKGIVGGDSLEEDTVSNLLSLDDALSKSETDCPGITAMWNDPVGKIKPLQALMQQKTLFMTTEGRQRFFKKLESLKSQYYDNLENLL